MKYVDFQFLKYDPKPNGTMLISRRLGTKHG